MQERGGLMRRKGWGTCAPTKVEKNERLSCSHGSLQKCFTVQGRAAAATIAFEYRLSLASIVCLPSSSPLLSPSPRFLATPSTFSLTLHSPFSYLIIHIHRVIRVLIPRRVRLTTCSRSPNCQLRPLFFAH